ncbi:hypothetical protein STCU_09930 [Strigomonas culicis]|uniref:Uncharacterized protein n=1 Tax=Strigomonas culicis TaxID=28005 RepID=S9TNZ1_9TRYP|nr:hypothetical protein STCU_09930 [Strigomonas culicis]|eukprot:EPY18424.1 hypothetical protein STCU_09930 [Strigomonas culicis]
MLDYTFQAFKKSVSEFSVSSDSSVQGSSTVRERVNSKLPPILMTRSDGSMGSPHRPPPPDECRGEWQNESILAGSVNSSRDASVTNRMSRSVRRVSFTGESRL